LRTAIDFVRAGLISPEEGLRRVDALNLDARGDARLVGAADPVVRGVGASTGIAVGRAAFESVSAERLAACREPVILVRPDISTDDVAGFAVAAGIVTAIGGRTAHAALVARQMGKPCIVGCDHISVDAASRRARFADTTVNESDWISIDGDSGHVYLGRHEVVIERLTQDLSEVEHWQATVKARKSA
jgi:pyruvate,orthophosphate dikinase